MRPDYSQSIRISRFFALDVLSLLYRRFAVRCGHKQLQTIQSQKCTHFYLVINYDVFIMFRYNVIIRGARAVCVTRLPFKKRPRTWGQNDWRMLHRPCVLCFDLLKIWCLTAWESMVTVVLVIGQRLLVKAYWFCDSSCRKGKYISSVSVFLTKQFVCTCGVMKYRGSKKSMVSMLYLHDTKTRAWNTLK